MTTSFLLALFFLLPSQADSKSASEIEDPRASALVTLDGEHATRGRPRDRGVWDHRRECLQRQVLVAAGLWPLPERTIPQAIVTGELDRVEYAVRRVALETWPGFWLTGNLYVPSGLDGPAAAVLAPHGHWANGRFLWRSDEEVRSELASGAERDESGARSPLQAQCASLARLGCIVFQYDMLGYAESTQLTHDEDFTDLDSILWGESHLGLQTRNSLTALDWVASLPEVDPARIGVAGASGGGTQTVLLCAIDRRPAAAFPAVMISSTMQGGCVCETAPHLRVDTNNVEISALIAPRALALTGANDWTIAFEKSDLPKLKYVWESLYGKPERLGFRCWPEYGHNFNVHAREFMYAWFDQHLVLGATKQQLLEAPFDPIEPVALAVFDVDHPLPTSALDRTTLRASLRAESKAHAAALVPTGPGDLERSRSLVRDGLEVLLHASLRDPELDAGGMRILARNADARRELGLVLPGGRGEDVALDPGDGRGEIELTWLIPNKPNGIVCVAVSDAGRRSFLDPASARGAAVRAACEDGTTFVLPEVLFGEEEARGESRALPVDPQRHARYAGYTWCYNRCLLAERARDVAHAIRFAFGILENVERVRVVVWGEGRAGTRALLAAALVPNGIERVLVDANWDFDAIESCVDPELLPGAMRFGGLGAFAGLCAPSGLMLASRKEPFAATKAWYSAAGAEAHLHAKPQPSAALAAWLWEAR